MSGAGQPSAPGGTRLWPANQGARVCVPARPVQALQAERGGVEWGREWRRAHERVMGRRMRQGRGKGEDGLATEGIGGGSGIVGGVYGSGAVNDFCDK